MLGQSLNRTIPLSLLLILLNSCSGSGSSPLAIAPPLQSESEPSTAGFSDNGVVLLRDPIRRSLFAADIRIDVQEGPDLPEFFTIREARFTRISTSIVPGKISYAADFDSALIALPSLLKLIIPLPDGLKVDLVRLSPTPGQQEEATSLIYTGDAPFITTLDLAILLATIQVSDPTAIEIADRANQLLGIPNLVTPQSLEPLPRPENANYVNEGIGILNTLDVAAVQASLQVGPVAGDIATRINELVNSPGLVDVSEILAIPGPQIPSEFIVTTVADSGPGSLRSIITLANSDPDRNTIIFAPAVRGGTITLASTLPTITEDLRIAGPGAGDLTLSGGNSVRIFDISSTAEVSIENLTIADGRTSATESGSFTRSGAGIRNQGSLSISSSTLSGNSTNGLGIGFGGAVYNTGSLTIQDSTLRGNSADRGGGIFSSSGSQLSVSDSTVEDNIAPQFGGGLSTGATHTSLTNTQIKGNLSNLGGGVFSSGQIDLSLTVLSGNSAASVGGGIFNSGTLNISNGSVSGNTANNTGGGIYSGSNTTLAISNTDFGNPQTNQAFSGADIDLGSGVTLTSDNNSPLACNDLSNGGGLQSPGGCPDTGAIPTGAQIVVTTLADIDNETDGLCSLREAIDSANSNTQSGTAFGECGPGDDINGSLIDLTQLRGTIALTSSLPDINSTADVPITLLGDSATAITISGEDQFRVLNVAANETVTIEGVTIANGSVSEDGAGILISSGAVVEILDSKITGNMASGPASRGGGIDNNGGTVSLRDSTLHGNSAVDGGGIFNSSGSISIRDSTLSGNSAAEGGGIFNASGVVSLSTSTLSDNSADSGGGIFNLLIAGTVSLSNSALSGNSATLGGGIFNLTGTVSLDDSTLSGNFAADGGGIYNFSGFISLSESSLNGNSATDEGGGIFIRSGLLRGYFNLFEILSANQDGDGLNVNITNQVGVVIGSGNTPATCNSGSC